MENKEQSNNLPIIIAVVAVVAIAIGLLIFNNQTQRGSQTATDAESPSADSEDGMMEDDVMMQDEDMMEDDTMMDKGNIVSVAQEAGSFDTLIAAVEAADLAETLQGPGPFTVFAPTDEAFEALPAGTLDELLADPEQLSQILLYHVVEGEVTAEQVVTLDEAETVQGSPVAISVVGGEVVLNESVNVVTTDVVASNGVIHVIDAVLLPPDDHQGVN